MVSEVLVTYLCEFLLYSAQQIPVETTLGGIMTIIGVIIVYFVVLLPVEIELLSIFGAFATGFEFGKHPLMLSALTYLLAAIAASADLLPFC